MEKDNIHAGHRDRMRQKCIQAPQSLSDHEILEILLYYVIPRRNTNALAHELLRHFGSITRIVTATPEDLKCVPGVGDSVSKLFPVLREAFCRFKKDKTIQNWNEDPVVLSDCVGELFVGDFLGVPYEKVILVGLDRKNHPIKSATLAHGTANCATLNMDLVCKFSQDRRVRSAVLMHNHPSGFAFPSFADKESTQKICEVLSYQNIRLVDHLIYDPGGDFISLSETTEGFTKEIPAYNVIIRQDPDALPEYNRELFIKEIKAICNCEKNETK